MSSKLAFFKVAFVASENARYSMLITIRSTTTQANTDLSLQCHQSYPQPAQRLSILGLRTRLLHRCTIETTYGQNLLNLTIMVSLGPPVLPDTVLLNT